MASNYAEKLKHPLWQRKRLEVLNAAGWECSACRSSEKTLHVHHKQYIKGRQPWEYNDNELDVLCEDCHEEAHAAKQLLDNIVSQFPSIAWGRIASLLVGYGNEYVDSALWFRVEEDAARAGEIAWFLGNLSAQDLFEARDICMQIGPDIFMKALRAAVRRDTNSNGQESAQSNS